MRLALISDVHGNAEALSRVLDDIDNSRIDAVVCLGDMIGYGPDPNEVIATIRNREIPTVIGNHEQAAIDPGLLSEFNPYAGRSLGMTVRMLTLTSFRFIQGLGPCRVLGGCRLVHGFPPASPQIYASRTTEIQRRAAFESMAERICFVGHTHGLETIDFDGERVGQSSLSEGIRKLSPEKQYIINVGSVGQPRDGNNCAKYAIWDGQAHTIEVRFVPYDIEVVAHKIVEMGLPMIHAAMLR